MCEVRGYECVEFVNMSCGNASPSLEEFVLKVRGCAKLGYIYIYFCEWIVWSRVAFSCS